MLQQVLYEYLRDDSIIGFGHVDEGGQQRLAAVIGLKVAD